MCTHPERQIAEWNPWERSECVERANRVAAQVGQAVNIAVERFVTVGESIASDVPGLRDDMFHACNQARAAGSAIEKLCDSTSEESLNERTSILRAARSLLNSVTRVLLLADVVIVKQLLFSRDKNARYVGRLSGVTNFTEFVKAFSQFGAEMVELSQLAGDRTSNTKEQRRKAQIAAAKQVLDRSTMLLLTSSKACLRHPDSTGCRENRDTIFCQMRRAMDLIHYVIKDGLCDMPEDLDTAKTVSAAIQQFESLVEMTRLTFITASTKESLSEAAESIFEQTQDFTDSAYTTHEHRESILVLCAQVKFQLDQLLAKEVIPFKKNCELSSSPSDEIEMAVNNCLLSTMELKQQLIAAALDQTKELNQIIKLGVQIMTALCNAALSCDEVRTQHYSLCFTQHIEQIVEVCKALRHIAESEKHQISIRYTEINVRIYGPQIIAAAVTLIQHPSSKIAKENIDVFIEMWHLITGDIISFYDEVTDTAKIMNKYTSDKSLKSALQPTQFPKETNTKGTSMNDGEEKSVKWQTQETSTANNAPTTGTTAEENSDIVKRAKSMSHMTYCMHQFTKGHGPLKTTQDLFTQAEYFAEEANRLYKVIRQFSYQVPVGSHKKELLEELDRIPTYVQQLQFTVKNPTVGKAATFTKVDSVINETKHMMNIITKVVSSCYVCANTYGLDLAGVSWEGGCGGSGGGDGGGRAQGDQSKGGSSSSSDQAI